MKNLFNTTKTYGRLAILLHWLTALAVIGLFGLGVYMVELGYYDPLYNLLPSIHKSIGLLFVPVFCFSLMRKLTNARPMWVSGVERWEQILAEAAHGLIYLLIAAILVSGYLIPTADGTAIDVFGLFSVPATITDIPQQEDLAGMAHRVLAYGLILLVLLHAAAALKHHFIDRDDTLRRMLGKSENNA